MGLSSNMAVGGLLTLGTVTSLFAKIVYELKGEGINGDVHFFTKPWAMTTVMFIGMSVCLPVYYLERWLADIERIKAGLGGVPRETAALSAPLLGSESDAEASPRVADDSPHPGGASRGNILMLLIPTVFDLIATVLMNVGLLSVTASVYQMMRGAELLFAAIFAVAFLGRKLNGLHGGGIGCCVIGIIMVGASSLFAGSGAGEHAVDGGRMLLGMGLIVLSQAVQAAQVTFEDFFMSELSLEPLLIVGYEGLFGAGLMMTVLLPAVYCVPGPEGTGLHEDTLDTVAMLVRNPHIAQLVALDCVCLALYNIAGMAVTGHLGAVFRTVLETTRTLFVWIVDLGLWYAAPAGLSRLGEQWTPWSWLQLGGFGVLVAGTLVYREGDIAMYALAPDPAEADPPEATATAAAAAPAPVAAPGHVGTPGSLLPPRSAGAGSGRGGAPAAAMEDGPGGVLGAPSPGRAIVGAGGLSTILAGAAGSAPGRLPLSRSRPDTATPVSVPRPAGAAPPALRPLNYTSVGSLKSTMNIASSIGTPSYNESLFFAMSRNTGGGGDSVLRSSLENTQTAARPPAHRSGQSPA